MPTPRGELILQDLIGGLGVSLVSLRSVGYAVGRGC